MSEIRFYHLQRVRLDQFLPELLGKALAKGCRILVRTPDEAEAERLSVHLWTHQPDSFLPHGSRKDGAAPRQPIWLGAAADNANGADTLILTGGAEAFDLENFTLCCELLDGTDEAAVARARSRWSAYKDAGHSVTYWQQGEKGGWEKRG